MCILTTSYNGTLEFCHDMNSWGVIESCRSVSWWTVAGLFMLRSTWYWYLFQDCHPAVPILLCWFHAAWKHMCTHQAAPVGSGNYHTSAGKAIHHGEQIQHGWGGSCYFGIYYNHLYLWCTSAASARRPVIGGRVIHMCAQSYIYWCLSDIARCCIKIWLYWLVATVEMVIWCCHIVTGNSTKLCNPGWYVLPHSDRQQHQTVHPWLICAETSTILAGNDLVRQHMCAPSTL